MMMDDPMTPLTRRSFLKLAAATGIVVSLGGCSLLSPSSKLPDASHCAAAGTAPDTEFDYIVVGSGAGGGPVAANLALAGYTVLLLKPAAKPKTRITLSPPFIPSPQKIRTCNGTISSGITRNDNRQNNDTKRDKNGKGVWYPRAGTLGGCTAHNAMITVYGHESDWDRIAKLTGDDSWSAEKMRKYFQRVERCQYASKTWDFVTGGKHGFDGWLSTERPRQETLEDFVKKDPQLQRILAAVALTTLEDLPGSPTEAFIRRAIPKLVSAAFKEDINHMDSVKHRPEGLYLTPVATNGGKRASVRDRIRAVQQVCPNQLIVKTNVLVTKVLLEKEAASNSERFKAVGVECREGAHLYRADPKAL